MIINVKKVFKFIVGVSVIGRLLNNFMVIVLNVVIK